MSRHIERIEDLIPDVRNANLGTVRGRALLERSLRECGAGRSILADKEGRIIAGNKTLNVAAELDLPVRVVHTDGRELVVVQRTDLDLEDGEGKARRLAYLDNRSGQIGLDWDIERIVSDLEGGVDLGDLWTDAELVELLGNLAAGPPEDPGPQIDRATELQEKWQTERGQVWEIGRHRVMCGDSTSQEDVAKLGIMGDMQLFTDPPYGINYDPSWLDGVGTHRQALSSRDIVCNDDGSLDLSMLWQHERRMVWGFPYIYDEQATGWLVWDKQPGVERRGIVTPIEMAATTMRNGFDMVRVMWGGYYRARGEDKQPHPTQKPIAVYKPFIEAWTKKGDVLADYFVGSGPVMVAAEQTGRICHGMEIEPKYIAVTLERLAGMGLEPRLTNA